MWVFSSYWWPDLQMFPVLRDPSQPLAFLIFTNANTPVLFPCMGTIDSQNCPFLCEKKSTPEVLLKVWRQGKCSINQNQESNWHFAHLAHTEKAHCRASLYCSFCPSEAIGLGRTDGSEYFSFISVVDQTKHWQKAAYGRKRRFIIWQFQITVHRSTEVTGTGALSSWSHPTVKSKEE